MGNKGLTPARPVAFTLGPWLTEVRDGDELLFTLQEEPNTLPIGTCRLRVSADAPDNFLTFNLTQAARISGVLPYYLTIQVLKRGKEEGN